MGPQIHWHGFADVTIENQNKKFFPTKKKQKTWVMTHCLITQKYASNYKVRVTEKRGKYSNRTVKTTKQ